MDDFLINKLAQLVYDRCGLNYVSNTDALVMKIARRMQELHFSLWQYLQFLESSPAEWDVLIELLTVNETYFYREEKQLIVYQQEILPQWNTSNEKLKVWSAACSSGEEPYSLAMITMDAGQNLSTKVEIKATDINKKVLKHAENALYRKQSLSFRRVPPAWLTTYFTETEEYYAVRDDVKEMVTFRQCNLLDQSQMDNIQEEYDVVFCRNVLIYFDEETIRTVVSYFHQALKPGGYLFLGHAENISNMDIGFKTINANGTFFYRKEQ